MNIEQKLRQLSKTTEHQNLFSVVKEVTNLKLFKNSRDLSRLQQFYISYLYFYHDIYMDIELKKVNPKVLEHQLYEDSYKLYKREKKEDNKKDSKAKDVHLVFSNKKMQKPKRGTD